MAYETKGKPLNVDGLYSGEEIITDFFYIQIGRFYTRGRIIRLNEIGKIFVVRLVIHL